jgi:hypothetical protein
MSNYTEQHDKIVVYLKELYTKHRSLDQEIKEMYNHFERDEIINRKKTQKLWLKDEIHRLETELKALK